MARGDLVAGSEIASKVEKAEGRFPHHRCVVLRWINDARDVGDLPAGGRAREIWGGTVAVGISGEV